MKKHLFFYAICLGLALKPLSIRAYQYCNEAMITNKIGIALQSPKVDNAKAVRFIKDFYTNCVFGKTEQISTLEKYCTIKLLKELRDDYGYDGEGYAIWNFRSGVQDGPDDISKVTSVNALNNGFYKVDFIDMGIKGSRLLKIVNVSGALRFDAIE